MPPRRCLPISQEAYLGEQAHLPHPQYTYLSWRRQCLGLEFFFWHSITSDLLTMQYVVITFSQKDEEVVAVVTSYESGGSCQMQYLVQPHRSE
jgi:hypothetical protein